MSKGSGIVKGRDAASSTINELERAWARLSLDIVSAAYRETQPTPHDEDPLRHNAGVLERSGATRDKLPTLREIDPLRYDLEA